MIDGMLAIDAHCHIGDVKAGSSGITRFGAEELLELMDQNGIDKAVVAHHIFPIHEREEFRPANDLVIEAIHRYPDRLYGTCMVNPRHGRFAEEEVVRCLEAGMIGIKLQPIMQGNYPVGGEILDPIMRIAAEAGVPISIHSDFNTKCCTPYELVRLALRHPRVSVVLLHMGIDPGWVAQTPEIVGAVPNLVVETSQTPDNPHSVFVNPARKLGADRVLFGSDSPTISLETNLAKLAVAEARFGLTREEKRKILGESAARVFNLPID